MLFSIIIPAYNEERDIAEILRSIITYMEKKSFSYEIIVVDDGSTDGTKKLVENIDNKNIRLISYGGNKGKGFAVKTGMLASEGEWALFTDADNAVDISNLDQFIPYFNSYDICLGSRSLKDSKIIVHQSFYKEKLGRVGNFLIRRLVLPDFYDTQCGFKCFKNEAVKKTFPFLETKGWGFDVEILLRAKKMGYEIIELPIGWRCGRVSRVKLTDYVKTFWEILRIKQDIR